MLSVGSAGSILSFGSAGSILSIGSAGSILSIRSSGRILCVDNEPITERTTATVRELRSVTLARLAVLRTA